MFQSTKKAIVLTTKTCLTLLLQNLYAGKLVVHYTEYCSFGGKKTTPNNTNIRISSVLLWFYTNAGGKVNIDIFSFGKPKPYILVHVISPY